MSTAVATGTLSSIPNREQTKKRLWPEIASLATYVTVLAVAIPYHEPWADEAQAWQLAKYCSISDLFLHRLRYEGHPGLWHLWLHALSRLHVTYSGMPWASAAVAVLGCTLLVFRAPFPRVIRLLLPFTFFLCFQYAVVARPYIFVPLLLFGTAIAWKDHPLSTAMLLGLLANTVAHTFVVACMLAILYAHDNWTANVRRFGMRRMVCAASLLALFMLAAVLTVAPPPPDLFFHHTPIAEGGVLANLLSWPITGFALTLVALSPSKLLSLGLWAVFVWALVRIRCIRFLLPLAALCVFTGFYGSIWHAGLVIPSAIAVCWILAGEGYHLPHRWLVYVAVAWAAFQIGGTVKILLFDHYNAYSPDVATSVFLAPHVAAGEQFATTYVRDPEDQFFSVGLAPYFSRPIFINEPHPYWVFSTSAYSDANFTQALSKRPSLVVAELRLKRRFDPKRDLTGARVAALEQAGYFWTQSFCTAESQGWLHAFNDCHLIFQPAMAAPHDHL